jgi:hypothetical protein
MIEYGFVVHTLEIKPEADDASPEDVSKMIGVRLNQVVQKAVKGLATLKDGGWVIMSHTITRIGKNMVVSMLISRQAPATP